MLKQYFVEAKKAYNDGRKDARESMKGLNDAAKSGDQAKIDEAKMAIEEVSKKISEFAAAKNTAWRNKKGIKTLIQKTLAELGIDTDDGRDDD